MRRLQKATLIGVLRVVEAPDMSLSECFIATGYFVESFRRSAPRGATPRAAADAKAMLALQHRQAVDADHCGHCRCRVSGPGAAASAPVVLAELHHAAVNSLPRSAARMDIGEADVGIWPAGQNHHSLSCSPRTVRTLIRLEL